ncbi:MAG: TonB family protein [Pyrinomonadaceae bacterium]
MKHSVLYAKFYLAAFVIAITVGSGIANAQPSQLSLADILIALRSKKVTLPERNKILSEAITTRGTTFALTPEIEKELSVGGAAKDLIESIRLRAIETTVASTASAAPVVGPDTAEERAEAAVAKGDYDGALIEYTKSIESDPKAADSLRARAGIYVSRGSLTLAIADLTKLAELEPQNAAVLNIRASAYEKKNQLDLAEADYRRVLTIEPENADAKAFIARADAERTKAAEIAAAKVAAATPPPTAKPVVVVPEFVDLGMLSESNAVRMVKPIYSQIAAKSRIGGKVVVNLELDKAGDVVSAKAISGHAFLKQGCEDAARKSKFKPATFQGQAVKGRGQITYNFVEIR